MSIFLISFFLVMLIMAGMAVGVILGRKPLQGSCGGLNKIDGLGECDICGGDRNKCDGLSKS